MNFTQNPPHIQDNINSSITARLELGKQLESLPDPDFSTAYAIASQIAPHMDRIFATMYQRFHKSSELAGSWMDIDPIMVCS